MDSTIKPALQSLIFLRNFIYALLPALLIAGVITMGSKKGDKVLEKWGKVTYFLTDVIPATYKKIFGKENEELKTLKDLASYVWTRSSKVSKISKIMYGGFLALSMLIPIAIYAMKRWGHKRCNNILQQP